MSPQTKREGPTLDSVPITFKHRIPVSKTAKFWEGLREGKLFATRCKMCGALYYPPQADCPRDMSGELEWVELSREGTLEAFTKVYARPQGFEDVDPYIVGIASLREGVRVMGWVEGVSDERSLRVGDMVEVGTREVKGKHIVVLRHRHQLG